VVLLSDLEDLKFEDVALFYGDEEAEAVDVPPRVHLSVFEEDEE